MPKLSWLKPGHRFQKDGKHKHAMQVVEEYRDGDFFVVVRQCAFCEHRSSTVFRRKGNLEHIEKARTGQGARK